MTIIIERKAEIGREQRNTRPARIYDGDFGVKMNAIRFEIWYISTEMAVAPILKNVVYNSASTAQVLMSRCESYCQSFSLICQFFCH